MDSRQWCVHWWCSHSFRFSDMLSSGAEKKWHWHASGTKMTKMLLRRGCPVLSPVLPLHRWVPASLWGPAHPENHWLWWNHKPITRSWDRVWAFLQQSLEWCISALWWVQIKANSPITINDPKFQFTDFQVVGSFTTEYKKHCVHFISRVGKDCVFYWEQKIVVFLIHISYQINP